MAKYLIEIKSYAKEFDDVEAMREFKRTLVQLHIPYREFDISLAQSIGLRGIEGVRYGMQIGK